jgi:hypothetical protein
MPTSDPGRVLGFKSQIFLVSEEEPMVRSGQARGLSFAIRLVENSRD